MGNGLHQCKEIIQATFGNQAIFLPSNPKTSSLKQIAALALASWNKQENMSFQIATTLYQAGIFKSGDITTSAIRKNESQPKTFNIYTGDISTGESKIEASYTVPEK